MSELVPDPGIDDPAKWVVDDYVLLGNPLTPAGTYGIDSNQLWSNYVSDGVDANHGTFRTIPRLSLNIGKEYLIKLNCTSLGVADGSVELMNGSNYLWRDVNKAGEQQGIVEGVGLHTFKFVASDEDLSIQFYNATAAFTYLSVDDLATVREYDKHGIDDGVHNFFNRDGYAYR